MPRYRTLYAVPPAEKVDYLVPQPEKRYCDCGRKISWWNRTGSCHVCQQKHTNKEIAELARDHALADVRRVTDVGKFGEAQQRQALFLQACGMTLQQIADRFGVAWITVQRYISAHKVICRDPECDCWISQHVRGSRGRPRRR